MSNLKRSYPLFTFINIVTRHVRSVWSNISLQPHSDPQLKVSRALNYMLIRVNNNEAQVLMRYEHNPNITSEMYVNATFAFLETLPAFGNDLHKLEFMDIHLLNVKDIDDTSKSDIPDHYIDNY